MIPVSLATGWVKSVTYVSALSLWPGIVKALALSSNVVVVGRFEALEQLREPLIPLVTRVRDAELLRVAAQLVIEHRQRQQREPLAMEEPRLPYVAARGRRLTLLLEPPTPLRTIWRIRRGPDRRRHRASLQSCHRRVQIQGSQRLRRVRGETPSPTRPRRARNHHGRLGWAHPAQGYRAM
jgi:hypothetical protein